MTDLMVKTVNCSNSRENVADDLTGRVNSLVTFNYLPSDTESLIMSHMSLVDISKQLIPILTGNELNHLTEVDLSFNNIKQLGHGSTSRLSSSNVNSNGAGGGGTYTGRSLFNFASGQHLTYLNLAHNEFKSISSGIFYGLKRLKVLNLSNGLIKFIDERAFDGLDSLQILNLQGNFISIIYLEIFQPILNLRVSKFSAIWPNKKDSLLFGQWKDCSLRENF